MLAATGARKVSLVGHSQGGMMPRYYLKFLGGAGKVDDLIGLAPSNHGTSNPGALLLDGAGVCDSCGQQATGSAFMTNLNAGDETPGNVSYTVVETRYDEVVIPYTSAFLSGRARPTCCSRRAARSTSPSTCRSSTTRSRCAGSRTRSAAPARPTPASVPAACRLLRARRAWHDAVMDGDGPRFGAMIALVAIVVATVILVFFGIGYALGRLFL